MKRRHSTADVYQAEIFKNDAVIRRHGRFVGTVNRERGDITMFSDASCKRLRFVAANTGVRFVTMITLTYPRRFPSDGILVKKHLHAFLKRARNGILDGPMGRAEGAEDQIAFSYLWFLEFQKRGAPHIHILLGQALPKSFRSRREVRDRVSAAWYAIVGSGDGRHLKAGTRTEAVHDPGGAARYVVKYAMKMWQKRVPLEYFNVGRFWGSSRDVKPKVLEQADADEANVRWALRDWKWKPAADQPVPRVLYGAAHLFQGMGEVFQAQRDTAEDEWYHGTTGQEQPIQNP